MPFQTKMRTTQFRWVLNIILAVIIFANAEVGRIWGIQKLPLQFSAVWPATGFALTGLLLFGKKAWPGVFAGNFIYNMLHLYQEGTTFTWPFLVALAVSCGSLAQALVGNWVMRRWCSPSYFKTVKDVMVFLLGGGFITCTIAATVGVTALYLYGIQPAQGYSFSWLTFWIGDVMGIYVCTPLLIYWSLHRCTIPFRKMRAEIFAMIVTFCLLIALFYVVKDFPPLYFFGPYCLWVGYRLGFYGASVAIVLIAITTISITTIGRGWIVHRYPTEALLVLVMFLETMIPIALFAGAVQSELTEKRS
jgi:integral membrane sensor domain MASE1